MKAATGNALLINIIITFLVVVLMVLITSITYTKAFRVKNRIIDIIEVYNGNFDEKKDDIINDINDTLGSVGYKRTASYNCPSKDFATIITVASSSYDYCIYEYKTTTGRYYGVTAYMYLDLPMIGNYLKLPVRGQTRVFYK